MNNKQKWLSLITQYHQSAGNKNGNIILLPGYQPELCMMLCNHLDMISFDYRTEEMQAFGHEVDSISLIHLDNCLQTHSQSKGVFVHNVEALLCIKTKNERRQWLQSFLNTDWHNPVYITIAVFQDDVPEEHPHVCDFELMRIPREALKTAAKNPGQLKYEAAGIKSRVF